MYRNDYDKTLERIHTTKELVKDFENIQKCNQILRWYERGQAMSIVNDVTREYRDQINLYGSLFDGTYVIENAPLSEMYDSELIAQINYIEQHIPVYVLMREGEKELAKKINEWLNSKHSVDAI